MSDSCGFFAAFGNDGSASYVIMLTVLFERMKSDA